MDEEMLRIEREIKFLKESLEAGIITEDEYDAKLQEIEGKKAELQESPEIPEPQEEVVKEEETQPDVGEAAQEEKPEVQIVDIPEEPEEAESEEEAEAKEETEEKTGIWKWVLAGIVVIILLFIFFPISTKNDAGKATIQPKVDSIMTIVNDNNCTFCDASRIRGIATQLFPGIEIKEIDISSLEPSMEDALKSLPSYIFDSNVTKAKNFDGFRQALDQHGDKFIMKPSASGSPYYFKRKETSATIDVYINPQDSSFQKLQLILDELRQMLRGNAKIAVILTNPSMEIASDLDITTSPTFVVNNQYKFTGLQTAKSILQKFCTMNGKVRECNSV